MSSEFPTLLIVLSLGHIKPLLPLYYQKHLKWFLTFPIRTESINVNMLTRHIRDIMKIPKSLDENFHRISEAKIYNSQPVLLHLFWNTFKDLNNSQSRPLSRFPTHPRLASRGWRRRFQEFESIQRWFESKKSVLWTWSFLWTGPPGICKEDKYFVMMWSKDRSADLKSTLKVIPL